MVFQPTWSACRWVQITASTLSRLQPASARCCKNGVASGFPPVKLRGLSLPMQVSTTSLSPGASTSSAWTDAMSVPSSLAKCGKSQGLVFSASAVASRKRLPSGKGITISSTQVIFTAPICQLNMAFSSCLHRVEETSSARVEILDIPLPRRSPRQDDFAKRSILDQMAQGFAGLAEGIDPLDDRLDGSAHDQRDDVPPHGGDRGR